MEKRLKSSGSKPVCSICIANYNGIGLIEACLRSVMEQDFDLPIEIIVHDDASTDGSADHVKYHFPEICLLESNENVGFCVSNNRMVSSANGKYILLLNNDAELLPDALRTFYEYAEMQSKSAILGIRQYSASTGDLVDFGILFDPFLNSVPNLDLNRRNIAMVMGACLWIPKRLWDDIGGFPDWFHTMHEDMYLCCLSRLYGYPVQVIPNSGYKHWIGKSLGGGKIDQNRISTSIQRRFLSERNRIYVMTLCCPGPVFYLLMPLHVFLLLIEGVVLAISKKNKNLLKDIYLKAFYEALKIREPLFQLRGKIQKKRNVTCNALLTTVQPMPHKLKVLLKYGFPSIT